MKTMKSNIEFFVATNTSFSLKTFIIGILSVLYDLSHSLIAVRAYREFFFFANCHISTEPRQQYLH